MIPKHTSSVQGIHHTQKPPFGSRKVPAVSNENHPLRISSLTHQHRFLTENDDVWSQNAWDHVPPPADQDATIAASLARQRAAPVPEEDKPKYNTRPAKHWSVPIFLDIHSLCLFIYFFLGDLCHRDNFYKTNASNFFKNRKWCVFACPFTLASQGLSDPSKTSFSGCTSSFQSSSLLPSCRCALIHLQ